MKKFEQIYTDIKNKIEDGTYKVNSFLPKEEDLASHYAVSRGTIRNAQKMLENDGRIKKIHGRGSKILDYHKFNLDSKVLTRFSDLSGRHKGLFTTKVITNKLTYLSSQDYGYDEVRNQPGLLVERLRSFGGKTVILDKDFFLTAEVGEIIPEESLKGSIYDYLEKEKGLKIDFAQKDITIEHPSQTIRLLLKLGDDSHVVVTRSQVYLYNMHLFQIHESFQQVDTFHLADIAKR